MASQHISQIKDCIGWAITQGQNWRVKIMNILLSKDENGVIWVKNEEGQLFGIVDQEIILDEEGIKFEKDSLNILESAGFELNQDWENEATYLEFKEENGEISRVVFCDNEVKLLDNDEINA